MLTRRQRYAVLLSVVITVSSCVCGDVVLVRNIAHAQGEEAVVSDTSEPTPPPESTADQSTTAITEESESESALPPPATDEEPVQTTEDIPQSEPILEDARAETAGDTVSTSTETVVGAETESADTSSEGELPEGELVSPIETVLPTTDEVVEVPVVTSTATPATRLTHEKTTFALNEPVSFTFTIEEFGENTDSEGSFGEIVGEMFSSTVAVVEEVFDEVTEFVVDTAQTVSDVVADGVTFFSDLITFDTEEDEDVLDTPPAEDILEDNVIALPTETESSTNPLPEADSTDETPADADTEYITTALDEVYPTVSLHAFVNGTEVESRLIQNGEEVTAEFLTTSMTPGTFPVRIEISRARNVYRFEEPITFGGTALATIPLDSSGYVAYVLHEETDEGPSLWLKEPDASGGEYILLDSEIDESVQHSITLVDTSVVWQNSTHDGLSGYDTLARTFFSQTLEEGPKTTVSLDGVSYDIVQSDAYLDVHDVIEVAEF